MKKILSAITFILTVGLGVQVLGASEKAPETVHAYLVGKMMSAEEVSAKLSASGFEVIGTFEVNEKHALQTVIYTSETLKAMANKPGRGFAAIGRILVDGKNNQISISNPVYFGKAFMQDDADYATLKSIKDSLEAAFSGLKEASDNWKYDDLSDYHFMIGMPYYQDSDVVGDGENAELLNQVETYKKGSMHLFTLKLDEGRYLVGCKLSKRTSKFPVKIGLQNSGLLPYTILIENDEARMLAPKYYLAVSYPQLTMGEFTTIATVPGAIEKDLSKPFK